MSPFYFVSVAAFVSSTAFATAGLRLDFASPGNGIPEEALKSALQSVGAEVRDGHVASFQQVMWGREGETTICTDAADIDAGQRLQAQFSELANIPFVAFSTSCGNIPRQLPTLPAQGAIGIEFISIGAGVDSEALDRTLTVIGDGVRDGQVRHFTAKHWGREGETSLCLKPMTNDATQDLMSRIKEATVSRLVSFSRLAGCE